MMEDHRQGFEALNCPPIRQLCGFVGDSRDAKRKLADPTVRKQQFHDFSCKEAVGNTLLEIVPSPHDR